MFAEYGITVMTFVVDCIFTVSKMRPESVGKIFELRNGRPAHDSVFVMIMSALNFLQKYNININRFELLSDFLQHEFPVVPVKTFVDVIS